MDLELVKRLLAETKAGTLKSFLCKEFACVAASHAGAPVGAMVCAQPFEATPNLYKLCHRRTCCSDGVLSWDALQSLMLSGRMYVRLDSKIYLGEGL